MFSLFTNPPYFGSSSKLCQACHHGDIETVKSLATADTINVKGWVGWAPLHKASQGGQFEIMEYILTSESLNADVNILDSGELFIC